MRSVLVLTVVLGLSRSAYGQPLIIPFTSGPIPPCDTSVFTADVWGVGTLYPPGSGWWSYSIAGLEINITTDHPEFLQITLTSPEGTTLLLSAFNGAGGQNYTQTLFISGGPPITSGSAPFSGIYAPQGGNFDVFDYEDANGTWTITVIDTACVGGPNAGGGNPGTNGSGWNPGWFDGSSNNGGFTIAFNGPPPCMGWIPDASINLCPGESIDIAGYYNMLNNGYMYTYMMPDGWSPIPDPTAVVDPGQYYIQAMDPWDGCMYWASYYVYTVPEIELGPDQVLNTCGNAVPVDLTAQFQLNGWESQSWSFNGSAISNGTAMAASTAGVYQMIAYNGGACGDTANVTLNIVASPVLGPDQGVNVCAGTSLDLTALYSTGTDATVWTENGVPVADPTSVTNAGIYTITATNAAGCSATADVIVTMQTAPALGADQSHDVCDNASLDLWSLYNTTGLLAAWSFAGVPVSDPSAVSAAGIYQLFVIDMGTCMDTAFVFVNEITSPALGPDALAAECAGAMVDLTALYNTTGMNAIWTSSGSIVADPTAVGTSGAYTLIATNAIGCSDSADVTVTISANPVLGPGQVVTACDGSAVDLATLYATGANATVWTASGVPVADPTSVTSSGSYTLTATNAAGCTATAIVTLVLDPAPALGADQSPSICAGSTYDLTNTFITTGLTPAWTIGGGPVADPVAVSADGGYQLVVSNGFGCTDTALVMLTVNPNPSLGPDQSFALCPWHSVDLSTVFPVDGMTATYTLDGFAVDSFQTVVDSGAYTVRITDVNGCSDEAAAFVTTVECLCEADFQAEARCIQDPAQFTLQADSTVLGAQWDFGGAADATSELAPTVLFAAEGEVLVTLQATLSCGVVTMQRTILLYDCSDSCSVWIPSAFTPDNDEFNDSWAWVGECDPEEFKMLVFNRWGELIYSTEDPHAQWDGTYQGVLSQNDVYVYRVAYRLPYQEPKEVIGHITLVR